MTIETATVRQSGKQERYGPIALALAKRNGLELADCEALSRDLSAAMDSLWRRRAWEIPEGRLENYVALGWMGWCGGALILTPAGRALHDATVERGSTP